MLCVKFENRVKLFKKKCFHKKKIYIFVLYKLNNTI